MPAAVRVLAAGVRRGEVGPAGRWATGQAFPQNAPAAGAVFVVGYGPENSKRPTAAQPELAVFVVGLLLGSKGVFGGGRVPRLGRNGSFLGSRSVAVPQAGRPPAGCVFPVCPRCLRSPSLSFGVVRERQRNGVGPAAFSFAVRPRPGVCLSPRPATLPLLLEKGARGTPPKGRRQAWQPPPLARLPVAGRARPWLAISPFGLFSVVSLAVFREVRPVRRSAVPSPAGCLSFPLPANMPLFASGPKTERHNGSGLCPCLFGGAVCFGRATLCYSATGPVAAGGATTPNSAKIASAGVSTRA